MDRPAHNGLPSPGCHGDGGGGALVQHCFCHHCSYCFQQTSHFVAVVAAAVVDVDVADAAAVVVVVFSVTSLTGFPTPTWTLQTLNFLLHPMWHCGYV